MNKRFRCVYCYEFPDNSVYVGITNNLNKRKTDRDSRPFDSVTAYRNKTGLIPEFKQLTDYINQKQAAILEGKYLRAYKKNKWIILNKKKTGGLGGNSVKWTQEKCIKEGRKYSSRTEFARKKVVHTWLHGKIIGWT